MSGPKSAHVTKLIAASYGIASLGLAFLVGRLGTVLQASIIMSGAIRGPLLALFVLAFFFPFVNAKGAIFGIITGVAASMFMAVGTLISPRPKAHWDLYTDRCSNSTYQMYGHRLPSEHILPWQYQPE